MGIYGDQILNEANVDESVKSFVALIFQHLLKFEYQPERQGKSWINSIALYIDKLEDYVNTSTKNKIKNNLTGDEFEKSYIQGRKDAIKEMKNPSLEKIIPLVTTMTYLTLIDRKFMYNFLKNLYHPNSYNVTLDYIKQKILK